MSSPSEYRWIADNVVLAIHEAQIQEHGGAAGLRDPGLLASALERPQNAAAYAEPDVPELAALYALGVIQNHPFVDGNKRVGTVVLEVFLEDNGYELVASDVELLAAIMSIAAGASSDEEFITWVRSRVIAGT